jgi:hypothetical protein
LSYDNKEITDELTDVLLNELKTVDERMARLDSLEVHVKTNMKSLRSEIDEQHNILLDQLTKQYKCLCVNVDKAEDRLILDIKTAKDQLQENKLKIEKLLKESEAWRKPVCGVPEAHITDVDDLVSEVRQQIPSADTGVVSIPTMKYVVGSKCVDLGKVIEEGISIIKLVEILIVYFIVSLVLFLMTYLHICYVEIYINC